MGKLVKMDILGIDPGQKGAFVLLSKHGDFEHWLMPLKGKTKDVDFETVLDQIRKAHRQNPGVHVFLERAMSMGMGSTGAFNYGRGFAALEIAIELAKVPCTYIEPTKWCKVMHDGISKDLKPKAKSIIAVNRLFPKIIKHIPKGPKSGKLDEGVVDALLIAGYGLRTLGGFTKADHQAGLISVGASIEPPGDMWVSSDTPKKKRLFTDAF